MILPIELMFNICNAINRKEKNLLEELYNRLEDSLE